jgi:hypothetical protein
MPSDRLTGVGFAGRFIAALVLVYATYNPEGVSYFHWAIEPVINGPGAGLASLGALKFVAGLLLLIGWLVFLQATRRSLGIPGAVLVLALGGGLIWLLVEWHVLEPRSVRAISHLALIVISLVLSIGMSWSLLNRRLSGQIDTDDVA